MLLVKFIFYFVHCVFLARNLNLNLSAGRQRESITQLYVAGAGLFTVFSLNITVCINNQKLLTT